MSQRETLGVTLVFRLWPMEEKSSTSIISTSRWGLVLSSMLCTDRSNTDHASLWKMITTLILGSTEGYCFCWHLYTPQNVIVTWRYCFCWHLYTCYRTPRALRGTASADTCTHYRTSWSLRGTASADTCAHHRTSLSALKGMGLSLCWPEGLLTPLRNGGPQ